MSDLAETFQNDISQLFNERALLRTELIAKEKLLTEAIVQKNSLNQSLKQVRVERDDLFGQTQKLKQEKLAAEAEKSASTIHVTILKEEKSLLEEKFYVLTQQNEKLRIEIEKLNRENQFLQVHQTNSVPIPIHNIVENRQEIEDLKNRNKNLERNQEFSAENHQKEIQIYKNEIAAKDEQIQNLHRLVEEYEQTIANKERIEKDLHQQINEIRRSTREENPEKMVLSDEERRILENDPSCASVLRIYRSSKNLFDILVELGRIEKQKEKFSVEKENFENQRKQNENLIHQLQSEIQQIRVQSDRYKFLSETRQNEFEQAVREKQNLFKEKLDLEKQIQQKQREIEDYLDDRLNMRAQIFHLLEQDNGKSNHRSFSTMIDEEIVGRQGVVTFQNVEELYEQYMKTLADIRETDRFILELEQNHEKELQQIGEREFSLKQNLEQIREKLEQTKTDLQIQTLAKQILERENQSNIQKFNVEVRQVQTELTQQEIQKIDENLRTLTNKTNEKDFQIQQLQDQIRFFHQKIENLQKQNFDGKEKNEQSRRLLEETLERNRKLLVELENCENLCEQFKEKNRENQFDFENKLTEISTLKNEIESIRREKEQISQFQEEFLDRIKKDFQTKFADEEENSMNVKLRESVDELNSIMKECLKQTELTNGTPAHLSNLTKLEIVYRQLQKRHQYDLERHFAISESLKIKAKDAQKQVEQLERKLEETERNFQEEQNKSKNKINELEIKLRNADTTTVLTRLLPSATLENRLKEEEERTQQLRTWTNKLTEKIENFQKQMAADKKEFEDNMEILRKELREARAECDFNEKRYEDLREENQKLIQQAKEKEESLEMEIYKVKNELDASLVTRKVLQETISSKENDLLNEHRRIVEYETKLFNTEKEFFELKEKYGRQKKDHNLPISEPASPCPVQTEINDELKTPSKRRRIGSSTDRTPVKIRTTRSQSVDDCSILRENEDATDENDDALSTCSEPPSAKKRKRRVNETIAPRLPAVNEEGDNEEPTSSAQTPTYNLRSRTKKITKLQPHQTT